MTGRFELRDHTADVAVAAVGDDLSDVFAAVADGLAAASCDDVPADGDRFEVVVRAETREALLFDYLDELVYQRDVRAVLPVDNESRVRRIDAGGSTPGTAAAPGSDADAAVDGDAAWAVDASARGVPLTSVDAREVKAVTYSEMRLEPTSDGWEAYVVFDV